MLGGLQIECCQFYSNGEVRLSNIDNTIGVSIPEANCAIGSHGRLVQFDRLELELATKIFGLMGASIKSAHIDGGKLELEFENGWEIVALPNAEYESWMVFSEHYSGIQCGPGGKIIWL
jgi:hypothetical protein